MKTIHIITGITFIAALGLSSCGQKAVTEETSKTTEMTSSTFDSTGYTSGTIVQSKAEGDCEWTIKLADGRHFDPMTMDKSVMKDGVKVWFKFIPQRRMNRCDKASPVEITEITIVK